MLCAVFLALFFITFYSIDRVSSLVPLYVSPSHLIKINISQQQHTLMRLIGVKLSLFLHSENNCSLISKRTTTTTTWHCLSPPLPHIVRSPPNGELWQSKKRAQTTSRNFELIFSSCRNILPPPRRGRDRLRRAHEFMRPIKIDINFEWEYISWTHLVVHVLIKHACIHFVSNIVTCIHCLSSSSILYIFFSLSFLIKFISFNSLFRSRLLGIFTLELYLFFSSSCLYNLFADNSSVLYWCK